MSHSHRIRALFVAALAVLGMGISPLPANATTLTITSLSCEPTPSALFCEGWVSGGSPAYTYTWNPAGNRSNFSDRSTDTIYCAVGTGFYVTFSVRDSLGATASKRISVYCSGGHQ
ncbi:MAG: hypothetical protein ABIQ09_19720 [Jatrophihabitantaceae bacterium]